jgi:hypothetical protein
LSIIKHVTLQKFVAHDFQYDPRSCRIHLYGTIYTQNSQCLQFHKIDPVGLKLSCRTPHSGRMGDYGSCQLQDIYRVRCISFLAPHFTDCICAGWKSAVVSNLLVSSLQQTGLLIYGGLNTMHFNCSFCYFVC